MKRIGLIFSAAAILLSGCVSKNFENTAAANLIVNSQQKIVLANNISEDSKKLQQDISEENKSTSTTKSEVNYQQKSLSTENQPLTNEQTVKKDTESTGDLNSIIYRNTEYSFSFSLPHSWKGYSILTDKWNGLTPASNDKGEVTVETGPQISIRHPLWTAQNPRQDIPIMIFTLKQWRALQNEKFHVSAAPIGPSELGRNDKYVFALPPRYNYAFPQGYEEVEKILMGNPLKGI